MNVHVQLGTLLGFACSSNANRPLLNGTLRARCTGTCCSTDPICGINYQVAIFGSKLGPLGVSQSSTPSLAAKPNACPMVQTLPPF